MQIVKNSIVIFFALGVTFFMLIFLFGVAKNDSTTNQIDTSVLIKENEIQRWGTIPGSLGYVWERTYNFYSLQTLPNQSNENDENLYLNKEDAVTSQVTRDFDSALWSPTVSVVEYYEKYGASADVEGDYSTFNMGALSIVHQMNNKPDFWLAWKALSQVNTLMFNSDIVNRYYAWNAFNYVFYDSAMVYAGVLGGFDAATAQQIYNDPFYGLDTINKVYYWVLANQGGSTSDDWTAIVTYFATKGITMDDASMQAICGENSVLGFATATVYDNILRIYDFKVEVDQDELIIYQWGQDSFLPNSAITIVPYTTPIYSLKDLNSDILVAPEFAYYVRAIQKNDDETFLDSTQCRTVLNAEYENYQTLLNPQNMEYFYVQYHAKNYADLMKRFDFTESSQVDSMYNYLEYMKENQLGFKMYGDGYNYEKNVLGQLI